MCVSDAAEAGAFIAATASVAWSAAYAWVKWLPHRHDGLHLPDAENAPLTAARLERLEAEVATLRQAVAEMIEIQHATRRMLESGAPGLLPPGPRPADPGRVITPH